jgi:hypothetical protein
MSCSGAAAVGMVWGYRGARPMQGLGMFGKLGMADDVDSSAAPRLAASSHTVRVSEHAASKSSGAVGLESTVSWKMHTAVRDALCQL